MKAFDKEAALKKHNRKQNKNTYVKRLGISLSCMFLIFLVMLFTFAKFESRSNEYTLINGRTIYNETGDIVLSYNVNGVSQNTPPSRDNYMLTNVQCNNADFTYDTFSWFISMGNYTGKVRCTLTFDGGNDIQKWLGHANINQNYTTISQVLNDTATLQALMNSNEACAYLEASPSWISNIIASEDAMTYIGANDYCADALFSSDSWSDLSDSAYYDQVLQPLVPNMTDATTPSGVARASSEYNTNYVAWKAFNSDTANLNVWLTTKGERNSAWLQYKFEEPHIVKQFTIKNTGYWGTGVNIKKFKIQGGDGTTFVDLGTFDSKDLATYAVSTYELNNNNSYRVYRLQIIENNGNANYGGIHTLQYYGR